MYLSWLNVCTFSYHITCKQGISLFSDSNIENVLLMLCKKDNLPLHFHHFCTYPCLHLNLHNFGLKDVKMWLICPESSNKKNSFCLFSDQPAQVLFSLTCFQLLGSVAKHTHPRFPDFILSPYLETDIMKICLFSSCSHLRSNIFSINFD